MTSEHDVTDHDTLPEEPHEPAPWWGRLALVVFVALVVCGYLGSAVAPRWALSNPEGLIALHARIRHLFLALGNDVDIWSYALIGSLRLAVAYTVCYLIGRAYGDRVLYYFGRYLGVTNESIDAIEMGFDKVDWLIIPWFTGSNLVAAFCGIRKVPLRRLIPLVAIGITARLALFWWLAQIFDDQLDVILDWIDRYQRPFLIGSFALVIGGVAINLRRGRSFER